MRCDIETLSESQKFTSCTHFNGHHSIKQSCPKTSTLSNSQYNSLDPAAPLLPTPLPAARRPLSHSLADLHAPYLFFIISPSSPLLSVPRGPRRRLAIGWCLLLAARRPPPAAIERSRHFLITYFHSEPDRQRVSNSSQMKVTKMLLIVSTVFVLLNLPSYVYRVRAYLSVSVGRPFDARVAVKCAGKKEICPPLSLLLLCRKAARTATKCLSYISTLLTNSSSRISASTSHYTAWAGKIFGKHIKRKETASNVARLWGRSPAVTKVHDWSSIEFDWHSIAATC